MCKKQKCNFFALVDANKSMISSKFSILAYCAFSYGVDRLDILVWVEQDRHKFCIFSETLDERSPLVIETRVVEDVCGALQTFAKSLLNFFPLVTLSKSN